MISLLLPELLLLALPAGALWWVTRPAGRGAQVLRGVVLGVVVLAIAGPILRRPVSGRDVVVVVDRSGSMPEESQERAMELIRLLEESRADGDRVGIVSIGEGATIERPTSASARFESFSTAADAQASDIGAGIDLAISMIPQERAGTIVLLTDGRSTEGSPLPSARRAAARGIPITTRELSKPMAKADLSVARLDLPQSLDVDEPFQFSGWVRADTAQEATWVLTRDGETISTGRQRFEPGLNRLVFRDALPQAGIGVYQLQVEAAAGDPQPQNNLGLGAVMANGTRRVLLLNDAGQPSTLSQTLVQAGMDVAVSSPEAQAIDAVLLSRYRSVILENVDAGRLGLSGMSALRTFVEHQGGGLLMTGGQASFGVGGYHKSPLEPVMPVSLELKQEHRKVGMALAVVLDRSGSMGVEVQPNVTKMDLANDGTAAAITLLSPIDSISVIAVDSEPHVIVKQTQVTDPGALAKEVARIESMGGGIYTRVGLESAYAQLLKAEQRNKHVILFSDAADSVQQEGVPALLKKMERDGITVSVIALGTDKDSDAAFLRRTAEQGSGEVYFTERPADLPRLFAMDTLVAARAAFIDTPTSATPLPSLVTLGLPSGSFPTVDAYNLAWPKPGATVGIRTNDENAAVILAWEQAGLGRSAAYTGQIGGGQGQSLVRWRQFSSFFVTLTRWTALQEPPADWYAEVQRQGRQGVVRVEVAADQSELPGTLSASVSGPDGTLEEVLLQRVGPSAYQATIELPPEGVAVGVVQINERSALSLPPLALPHSPEFAHLEDPKTGSRNLERVARITGGGPLGRADALWDTPQQGTAGKVMTRPLLILALLLLLLEIGLRRLMLWDRISALAPKRDASKPGFFARRAARKAQAPRRSTAPSSAPSAAPSRVGASKSASKPASKPEPPPEPPPKSGGMGSAMDKARNKAGRKLKR